MISKNKNAFTLVELIVVILILAILWTIAFISLQWYSTDARDSTRISDLSSMKTSLEVFQLDAGKYPIPTDWVDIIYSWATVWTQWTFWKTVYSNVSSLDKIPTDPLVGINYTYSTTQNRWKYQLWWIVEWDTISINIEQWIVKNVLAVGKIEATAIVTWTYNWEVTKSLSWTIKCNILAVPSIITNDTSITTDLETINIQKRFVYTWKNNLPSSFKSSKFNNEWWFDFQLNKLNAYTDITNWCSELTSKTSTTQRVKLLKWIQEAYNWTTLKNEWEIKNILSLDISDINKLSQSVKSYAWQFVNNNLGWSVDTSWWNDSPTETLTWWMALDLNCDIEDIILWTQVWAWCNSTLWNWFEYWQTNADIWTSNYNWTVWSCYDYSWNNTATCTKWDISMTSNTKANSWFNGTNTSWDSEYNNIWWKFYTWSNSPSACPTWRHVPSDSEWETLETYLNGSNCRNSTDWWLCDWLWWNSAGGTKNRSLANSLKLPLAGYRDTDSSTFHYRGLSISLWASTPSSTNAYGRWLGGVYSTVYRTALSQDYWFPVRCIKD